MAEKLSLPELPKSSMFMGEEKTMTIEWQEFFRVLFKRVGGLSGPTTTAILLADAGEVYSTPINYTKRINELEKKLLALSEPKTYDKRINELEKKLLALSEPKAYDKDIEELKVWVASNFLNQREPFKFYLPEIVYEDLQVSISNIRVPAVNTPTERLYNHGIGGGITFPVLGFIVDDYMYFDVQTHHAAQLNQIIDNHIHWILPNTTDIGDKFKFQLDVIAAGVNAAFAVPTGSPFTAEHTIVANDNTNHRVLQLADIPAVNSTVSTIYSCVLTRIAASADEYGSEVYIKFNDCHYLKDTCGSRSEDTK